jgi:hypothetical protein
MTPQPRVAANAKPAKQSSIDSTSPRQAALKIIPECVETITQPEQFAQYAAEQNAAQQDEDILGAKGVLHPNDDCGQTETAHNDILQAVREAPANNDAETGTQQHGNHIEERTRDRH